MSYTINKTDGSVLTEITDGTVDQTATDLTLIGKNASSYGEFFNENLIKLLENFANTSQPNNPIAGQLWFDTSENRLKVYDGSGFKVSGGTIVSANIPSAIGQGDIWIDSTNQQMYFNDGSATVLVGPLFSSSQTYSGFQVVDVVDASEQLHTVVFLYVAQVLLGIFSNEEFTPANTIPGYTGDIKIGFNASNLSGNKFRVPVEQADTLLASDGVTTKTVEDFVSTTEDSVTLGTLTISNQKPLILGPSGNVEFQFGTLEYQLNSNVRNQNFQLGSLNAAGTLRPSIYVDAENERVGIYNNNPQTTLDVTGDVTISGNLTINGSTTTISTTNITVEDKNIVLASGSSTDEDADGGGVTLSGASDKTIAWSLDHDAWDISENINIPFGKSIKINNIEVLNYTTLPTVTSAPSLSSIGSLQSLTVDNLVINENSITFTNAIETNGNIVLAPKGSGTVDVSNKKITSLATPTASTDAVNVDYLNLISKSLPVGMVLDVTGLTDEQIGLIVSDIFPVVSGATTLREEGTVCRIHCLDPSAVTPDPTRYVKQYIVSSGAWAFDGNESSNIV
jgi:hypothetical protein